MKAGELLSCRGQLLLVAEHTQDEGAYGSCSASAVRERAPFRTSTTA